MSWQIRDKFGHQVEAFFVILTAVQFHLLFYCSRALPNVLALGLGDYYIASFMFNLLWLCHVNLVRVHLLVWIYSVLNHTPVYYGIWSQYHLGEALVYYYCFFLQDICWQMFQLLQLTAFPLYSMQLTWHMDIGSEGVSMQHWTVWYSWNVELCMEFVMLYQIHKSS